MRIISFNANGLRSAASKGFFDWFRSQDADVLCVQETKAQEHQLGRRRRSARTATSAWFKDASTKKGYSGVAIYSRREPDEVRTALGWAPFDDEGRYIEARFGNLSVVSFYIPSGSSGEERQGFKFEVMDWLKPRPGRMARQRPRLRAVRRLEHRALAPGHQELDQQPEELRLPAARARLAQRRCAPTTAAGSTPTARCTPMARTTPGGAIAAPRAPTTSVGASTTSWRRRRCATRLKACSIARDAALLRPRPFHGRL